MEEIDEWIEGGVSRREEESQECTNTEMAQGKGSPRQTIHTQFLGSISYLLKLGAVFGGLKVLAKFIHFLFKE